MSEPAPRSLNTGARPRQSLRPGSILTAERICGPVRPRLWADLESVSSSLSGACRQAGKVPDIHMDNSHHRHRRYATERFVEIVWRGVHSAEDPRTIPLWAQISGTSRSPLSTLCKMLGVSPRGARDFTRLFRALVMAGGDAKELHEILNVSAPTTLDELFARAGLESSDTLTPLEFLERQRLVRNEHVLDALKRALERTAPAAEQG